MGMMGIGHRIATGIVVIVGYRCWFFSGCVLHEVIKKYWKKVSVKKLCGSDINYFKDKNEKAVIKIITQRSVRHNSLQNHSRATKLFVSWLAGPSCWDISMSNRQIFGLRALVCCNADVDLAKYQTSLKIWEKIVKIRLHCNVLNIYVGGVFMQCNEFVMCWHMI